MNRRNFLLSVVVAPAIARAAPIQPKPGLMQFGLDAEYKKAWLGNMEPTSMFVFPAHGIIPHYYIKEGDGWI